MLPQAFDGRVPLGGGSAEVVAGVLEGARDEGEAAFAADARAGDEAGVP